ncbi:hypothetical protein CCHR01_12447 [Colletotrichum chrysophilum]|uniref:Uncharacterized protein n=1 Tax=Colletotrichum chrysophilum TaxID=1836956 RepID=A0AAD9EHH7_9PEZI|nr:hypothetical protein CCHR01_12447 [Colletotrichum chrysophilum]
MEREGTDAHGEVPSPPHGAFPPPRCRTQERQIGTGGEVGPPSKKHQKK